MSDERFAARARDERRRRLLKIALAVLAVVVAGVVAWLIWFSSVLAVRDVDVSGRSTLRESQVLDAADVPTGRPLARVDVAAIEGRIASLERIDSVDVTRSWPHTLSISVVERQAVIWSTSGGTIRGIDRNGIDFRSYRSAPKGLLEAKISAVDGEERLRVARSVARVVELVTDRDPALRKQIQSIRADTLDSIELDLTEGRTVVWGSSDDGARKLQVLEPLLGIDAARYDVSAPDQPTTRQ